MGTIETFSKEQNWSNKVVPLKSKECDNVTIHPNKNIGPNKHITFNVRPYDDRQNRINNKAAYIRLHRHSFSPGSNLVVEKLKGKYENSRSTLRAPATYIPTYTATDNKQSSSSLNHQNHQRAHKLSPNTISILPQKYSAKSSGYPKTKPVLPSKIPIPTSRTTLSKPQPKVETVRVTSSEINKKLPIKAEITPNNFEEVQLIYSNIKFAKPEDKHFIVTRSSSEDSVLKVENSLADFIMEKKPKEKKRSNSFRRILSGGLFGRDKKKQEEEKNKSKKKDNAVFADNAQNESQVFDRFASHRHTVDNSYPRQVSQNKNSLHHTNGPLYLTRNYKPHQEYLNSTGSRNFDSRYTDMNGGRMVSPEQPNYTHEDYVHMDNSRRINYLNVNKFIDTSSSSSNTELDSRSCTYQNALVAQAELRHIRENENRKNALQGNLPQGSNSFTSSSSETSRSTPPSSHLELVKPKALIPISSERPLPNPYHNIRDNSDPYENIAGKGIEHNLDIGTSKMLPNKSDFYEANMKSPAKPVIVEDVYGTVFDSISTVRDLKCDTKCVSPVSVQLSPKSLEGSKLKLPTNREKIELHPRIRSPLPQTKVSTDKIIATELLRNRGSPSRSPYGSIERQQTSRSPSRNAYENQELKSTVAHSTPQSNTNEYIHLNTVTSIANAKPPLSPRDSIQRRHKEAQQVTLATVHADATDRPNVLAEKDLSLSNLYIQNAKGMKPNYDSSTNTGFSPYCETRNYCSDDLYAVRRAHLENPEVQNFRQTPAVIKHKTTLDDYREELGSRPHSDLRPHQQCQRDSINSDISYSTIQNIPKGRPQTPIGQNIVTTPQKSPEKQHMIQNVEAFYWRELKKLKEREEQDLRIYRDQQFYVYGYVEEPVAFRRSRSVSPTMQRGKRSLSLPREAQRISARPGTETIKEGYPVIGKRPIILPNGSNGYEYGQIRQNFERNPNFVRNTIERTTIGPIGRSRYYEQPKEQNIPPIFKRGSLTPDDTMCIESQQQMNKKVSFSNQMHPTSPTSWPTKNGFTQSPPTRRIDRKVAVNDEVDDVFPSSRIPRHMENIYANDGDTALSQSRFNQLQQHNSLPKLVQQRRPSEPSYESTYAKHVTVSNKVCDIYGQIHDSNRGSKLQLPSPNYGQIRQMGYIYGQLQQSPNQQTPVVMRQSFDHLNSAQPFVRGTRLTASANDMYRHYQVDSAHQPVRNMPAPTRPLPPVPERRDSRSILAKRYIRGHPHISDTESGSEASEVQRILGAKQKNFSAMGK